LETDVAPFDLAATEAEHIRRDRVTELDRAKNVSLKERKQLAQKMAVEEKDGKKGKKKKRTKGEDECDDDDFGEDDDDRQIEEDEANDIRTRDKLRDDEWDEPFDFVSAVFQPRKESKREVKRSWKLNDDESKPKIAKIAALESKKIVAKKVARSKGADLLLLFFFLFVSEKCSFPIEAVKKKKILEDKQLVVEELETSKKLMWSR
jgi:hypothetical protein